jgi:hypothetical protein
MGLQLTVEEDEDRTIPEDTILRGKLIEIEPREIAWNDKRTGERKTAALLEFWWEVQETESVDPRFVGRRVKGSTNAKATPNSPLIKWAEALLGRSVGVGMKLDTDDLIGLSADIVISHRNGKDGRIFEQVGEVLNPDADPWGASQDSTPPF